MKIGRAETFMRRLSTIIVPLTCCTAFIMLVLIGCHREASHAQDLDFIYNQIKQNHPGIHNAQDPGFKGTLDRAYQQAREVIAGTTDATAHRHALETFAKHFSDPHLHVDWHDQSQIAPKPTSDAPRPEVLFTITQLANGTSWITVPTFYNMSQSQRKSFNKLLEALPSMQDRHCIVFDIRGNRGGNSEYASRMIDQLFGRAYAQQQRCKYEQNVSVDWRASADNLAYMQSFYEKSKTSWLKQIADGMRHSIERNVPYYHEPPPKAPKVTTRPNPVKATLVAVIDDKNGSAALDFIDELKMMDHPVTLVGKTTMADRLYMELRTTPLPSHAGTFSFPIKVYRGRIRGDNEPYVPDYEADTSDTAHLEAFIM